MLYHYGTVQSEAVNSTTNFIINDIIRCDCNMINKRNAKKNQEQEKEGKNKTKQNLIEDLSKPHCCWQSLQHAELRKYLNDDNS